MMMLILDIKITDKEKFLKSKLDDVYQELYIKELQSLNKDLSYLDTLNHRAEKI